jgi:hypothetical protein
VGLKVALLCVDPPLTKVAQTRPSGTHGRPDLLSFRLIGVSH